MAKCDTCDGYGNVGTSLADAMPCGMCWCDICKDAYGERPCRDCGKGTKENGMNDYAIREDIKESIDAYVESGRPLGGFLTVVMGNDLMQAVGRADEGNRLSLHAICSYIYNEIPEDCHGSPEKVEAWYAKKDAERSKAAHLS